jgi:uncharacterized membrane protein YeiH
MERMLFYILDLLGVAVFAVSGALAAGHTGLDLLGGGVLRDVLTGHVPLLLRRDIYATATIAGIALYLVLQRVGTPGRWAFVVGMAAVVALRLLAVLWGWQIPSFRL